MAHYVAKKLHLRPNSVLDDWGVPELIVAYGIYKDEESAKHHAEVKAHNKGLKGSDRIKVPQMYAVKFMGTEEEDVNQDAGDRSKAG